MTPRVKVCGLTRPEDVMAAVDAGADALGFNFVEGSPRRITADSAALLTRDVPPFVTRVGVFADAATRAIEETVRGAGLDWVQLHGEEPPEACEKLGVPWYKAHRVGDGFDPSRLAAYGRTVFLLDAAVEGIRGGSGRSFDWAVARAASGHGRVILAGGLTPDNIARAITVARPWAVDVSSGVEDAPGRKNHELIRRFITAVRATGRGRVEP